MDNQAPKQGFGDLLQDTVPNRKLLKALLSLRKGLINRAYEWQKLEKDRRLCRWLNQAPKKG